MAGRATTVQLVPACQGPPPVDGASARLRPVKASLGRVEAGGGEAEGSNTAQPVERRSCEPGDVGSRRQPGRGERAGAPGARVTCGEEREAVKGGGGHVVQ